MRLLFESRKEDAILNLQNKFKYDKNFIRRIFDLDPTYAGKYATYIEKTLPLIIKGIAGEEGGLSVGDQTRIENIYQNIRWFELNYKYITPSIIEEFLKDTELIDNPDDVRKSPKDIYSYKNPFSLIALKDVVEKKRTEKDKEVAAKSQVNKLLENDRYLVVEPLSFVSSCYYGKNTKWCVTGDKVGEGHYNTYTKKGRIIFFIDKNNPSGKYAMFIPKSFTNDRDLIQVWDDQDRESSIDDLYVNYAPLSEFIDELTNYKGNFYKLLVGFTKGVVSAQDLMNGDELIYNMRGTKSENKESAILILKFADDHDYYDVCDLDEDDLGFVKSIFNPYSNMEINDPYNANDTWLEGHIYNYFNEENKKKFDTIVNLLDPTKKKDRGYYDSNVFLMVSNLYEKDIDNIIYNWSDNYNDALVDGNKDYIIEDLGELFFDYGIHKINVFYKYFTTVGNLISLYEKFDLTKRKNITDLLKTISSSLDTSHDYWDYVYEVDTSRYFDKESFNRTVSTELDDIMEKLEENDSNINFIRNVSEKILSKYTIDRWYTLPTHSNTTFQISGIDRENEKIELVVRPKGRGMEKIKVSIDEFFQFLNTYPLFK